MGLGGTAKQKPAKGTALLERMEKKQAAVAYENEQKRLVRQRDGGRCRWPACGYQKKGVRLEVAHLNDKGMGGDHGTRSTPDQMILLCFLHHQGPRSLHSGDLAIECLTPQGADAPVAFYDTDADGRRFVVAMETSVGGPYARD